MGTEGSAAGFSPIRPDHILPKSRIRPQIISNKFGNQDTRLHTVYVQNKTTKGSTTGFELVMPDHLLSEARTRS
jgi:hypothetical protein